MNVVVTGDAVVFKLTYKTTHVRYSHIRHNDEQNLT